jgi:hypothetical protein
MIWFYILSSFIIQKNYNDDSLNNPPNCVFTLLSSNVNIDNHNADNQCVHGELQMPNLWRILGSIPCL